MKHTQNGNNKTTNTGKSIKLNDLAACASETTVYHKAVPRMVPDVDVQINQFIADVQNNLPQKERNTREDHRKLSNSSDEVFLDISEESEDDNNAKICNLILGKLDGIANTDKARPGPSGYKTPAKADDQAEEVIKEAESSKVKLYKVPGKEVDLIKYYNTNSIALMDNEYQMIDLHLDEQTWRKIQCFEHADFVKLVPCSRSSFDDQRLELISKNGMTYLSPVAERNAININSYLRWEQAFRVYSNVLTA